VVGKDLSACNPRRFSASSSAMITGNTSPLQSSKRTLNSHLYAGSSSSSDPGGSLHCGQTGEMEICHLSRQM